MQYRIHYHQLRYIVTGSILPTKHTDPTQMFNYMKSLRDKTNDNASEIAKCAIFHQLLALTRLDVTYSIHEITVG